MTGNRVCFVIRSAQPGNGAKILLQMATNTYNAYNNWGGYSLYDYNGIDQVQGRRVSIHRSQAGESREAEIAPADVEAGARPHAWVPPDRSVAGPAKRDIIHAEVARRVHLRV